jgi:cytochrome c biogenesis protein CcmG, thiol:disulfide interchange protein DsbE
MPRPSAAELDAEARPGRSRRRLMIGLAAVFTAAALAAGIAAARNGQSGPTSKAWGPAPKFSLPALREGEPTVSLEDFRGRPLVLNFFASWCDPCQRELPAFNRAAQRYQGKVAFVGVTFNDDRPSARSILDKTGVHYPAGFDAKSEVATDYGLRVMPTTYFISAKGKLIERAERELTEGQLTDVLDRLFDV